MRIERLDIGGEPSFRLLGRLEGDAARRLLRMLNGAVGDGSVVTINLDSVQTCDAAGVAALVSLSKRAREAGGALLLTAPRERVLHELDRTGALRDLQIAPENNATHEREGRRPRGLRYLTRIGEQQPFAYAPNRRDFYLVSDNTLWAHESHDWLLATGSGEVLAHRTCGSYYNPDSSEALFTETTAPLTSHVLR